MTPRPDPDDVTIRTLLRTAVATAPDAPTVEEIDDPRPFAVADLADRRRSRLIRVGAPLTAAAAAITILVTVDRSGDHGPATTTAPGGIAGLPSHVLPATLPDGWRVADIIETDVKIDAEMRPFTELFRRRTDGAAIWLFGRLPPQSPDPSSNASVATTTAANATPGDPVVEGGVFRYPLFDAQVAGVDDAAARRMLDGLSAEGVWPSMRFTSPDPAWVLESESPYEPTAPSQTSFARIQLRNEVGTRIDVDLQPRSRRDDGWRFGVPVVRGDATLYVSDQRGAQSGWSAGRSVGGLSALVSVFSAVADDATVAAAADLASSLHEVTISDWQGAHRTAVSALAAAPVRASLSIGDLAITHHVSGWIDAVCATTGTDTSCHQNNQTGFGPEADAVNTPSYDPLAVGHLWALVGYSPSVPGAPSYPLVAESSDGRRVGAVTPRSTGDLDGKLFAFVAPEGADTLREADINNPQATFGSEPFRRPIH